MSIATVTRTTGSVPAGGSLTQSLLVDASISRFWILKLQITPSASGGDSIYQVYSSNAFSGDLAYEARANSLSPFYDPVKRDASGNMTEEGIGVVGAYEDEDGTGKLHIKISNQAAAARTYQVKLWYIPVIDQSDVLTKNNTTEFTPDADYEPATKKYVDDNVISGGIPAGAFTQDGGFLVGTAAGAYQEETGATARASLGIDSLFYTQAEVNTLLDGYVTEALFDANTLLVADDDDTPLALTIAEQRILGRVTGGSIAALTGAQVKTIVGNWDERYYTESEIDAAFYTQAEVNTLLDGYVTEALFDANTLLIANDDNTPITLSVAASRILGRASSGGIAALTGAQVKTIVGNWDERYYTETEADAKYLPLAGGTLSGTINANNQIIDNCKTVQFNGEYDNGEKTANFTLSLDNGQKQKVTLTANTITMTVAHPTSVGTYQLKVVNGGLATLSYAANSGSFYVVGGSLPTLTSSGTDFLMFYSDGTNISLVGWALDVKAAA